MMMMMITNQDKIRSKIQDKAVDLFNANDHICLEWSTGVGKSLAAIKMIKSGQRGYLICKESTHLSNWEAEFKKHKKLTIMRKMDVFLYASLHKYQTNSTFPDFIILDECHALTEKRVALLKPIIGPLTKVILLSATIPESKKDLIIQLIGKVRNYKIPLLKAIDLGLLPKPELIVHKMKLTPTGKYEFKFRKAKGKITKYCDYKDMWKTIKMYPKDVGITVKCNEIQFYELISRQMSYFKDMMIKSSNHGMREACRNRFLNLGSQRKKFISKVKTVKTASIVKQFRGSKKRFICFTGAIDQSIVLGAKSSVNSKNLKEYNQDLINCFNDGSCSELFAVKMLRESVNLTNIEKGIIVQLDSTVGSFFQMFGRCLRHDFPEMHLIVIDGTQDEVYFERAMEDFDNKYVKYV
jgi:superfamily II DNA or RNA helicase